MRYVRVSGTLHLPDEVDVDFDDELVISAKVTVTERRDKIVFGAQETTWVAKVASGAVHADDWVARIGGLIEQFEDATQGKAKLIFDSDTGEIDG
jgi:hypothetical protein